RVIKPTFLGADKLHSFYSVHQPNQSFGERQQLCRIENWRGHKPLQSLGKPDNARQVLCSRPPFVLMTAAKENRVRQQWRFDEKCSSTFRSVELVGADGNQIRVELMNVLKRLLSKRLHRIRMKNYPALLANGSQFRYRLNRTDLIVRCHHRN